MSTDIKKLFEEQKQKEVQKVENRKESKSRLSDDPRFIHFKSGNTYRMRLLYYIPEDSKRKVPFIHKNTHSYYNEATSTLSWAVCPTSEYLLDNRGFKECKVCEAVSDFYKKSKESPSNKELYEKFKRRFNGFALVYVVNDPTNEANNNTVKIIRYGILINRFLKKEIFGIDTKENKVIEAAAAAELVGPDAFDLENGYDLIITVGTNNTEVGDFNSYDLKFTKKPSKLNVTEAEIAKQTEALNFDKDFYEEWSKTEILDFYNKYVLNEEVKDVKLEDTVNTDMDELPHLGDKPAPVKPVEAKQAAAAPATPPPAVDKGDENLNIDALLKKVESNY